MYQIDFHKPLHIHFIGIGGISMSGLAEILLEENFRISGSDAKASPLTRTLEERGAVIYYGQRASNIKDDVDVVVYTAAIHPDNPEFACAKEKGLPMLTRAELLGQIMRNYDTPVAISGTHGKTTTTSMVSHILLAGDCDPTISVGGILPAIGGNIRVGSSDYFVTEACEYTNSFHAFSPYISIILNVDADHLDFFSGIEEIAESFHTFATKTPENGKVIVNGDMQYFDTVTRDLKCQVITFGEDTDFDKLFEASINLDAEDVTEEDGQYKVITSPENFQNVVEGLEKEGFKSETSELTRIPQNMIEVTDEKTADQILKLLDKLEEHDDVQNVYANCDIPDEIVQKLEG